jgi:hypothetical protein
MVRSAALARGRLRCRPYASKFDSFCRGERRCLQTLHFFVRCLTRPSVKNSLSLPKTSFESGWCAKDRHQKAGQANSFTNSFSTVKDKLRLRRLERRRTAGRVSSRQFDRNLLGSPSFVTMVESTNLGRFNHSSNRCALDRAWNRRVLRQSQMSSRSFVIVEV